MHRRLNIWAPLPPGIYLRRPRPRLPFPLEEPDCRIVAWARHGIWRGVQGLGLRAGDAVLMPAYHHGSEVEALLRAGLECRFYEATSDLAPDPEELEGLLDDRVRALYLTHFLGFPQDALSWRGWCDEHGLLLIEDAAQAWLAARDGRPVGATGDLALFCLYKTVGLSEGAAVLQRDPDYAVDLDPRLGARQLLWRHGMWLAGRSALVYALSAPFRRPRPYEAGRDFDLRDPDAGPWRHTPFVLRRIADPATARRRRENYRVLLEALRWLVPEPFDELPEGASPFVFPIVPRDAERATAELIARGVGNVRLWTVAHPSLRAHAFPAAERRREGTLGLPVHQELQPSDLRLIAESAASAAE